MAELRPFRAIRPRQDLASRTAALPYDVYSRPEAKEAVKASPLSFLRIDRAETQLSDDVDTYDDRVYEKAKEIFETQLAEGVYLKEEAPCYYLYELVMNGRSQTGIVGCASINDYETGVIRKHENTREDKELDRIRHVEALNAQTGPIFLTYRDRIELRELEAEVRRKQVPLYDFVAEDEITHRIYRIAEPDFISRIHTLFREMNRIYIADGHHRCASAVKVGVRKRQQQPEHISNAEAEYVLAVLFPDSELQIMAYNRVVADLNGMTVPEFLERIKKDFMVETVGKQPVSPSHKGEMGMYLDGCWYRLGFAYSGADPVKRLDVSILQDRLLLPVLGIADPRTDQRIAFVGGIRGAEELMRRVDGGMAVAFSMYPTSMEELFAVADAGLLMPPKSTWFEPKLRSGLLIHSLE